MICALVRSDLVQARVYGGYCVFRLVSLYTTPPLPSAVLPQDLLPFPHEIACANDEHNLFHDFAPYVLHRIRFWALVCESYSDINFRLQ